MNTPYSTKTKSKCAIQDIMRITQSTYQPLSLNHLEPISKDETSKIFRNLYTKSSGDVINNLFMKKTTSKINSKPKNNEDR